MKPRLGPLAALGIALASQASAQTMTSSIDPLTVAIDTRDADRFAMLMRPGQPLPDAAALQSGYLHGAGRGVEIFTPYRIENAANLAKAIVAEPERYRHAIDHCLPIARTMNAELRSVYLAYRGLLPSRALPAIHVVFGANNSGGTANPDAQVIGLEVMCSPGQSTDDFRAGMRAIFAHETVHTWQAAPSATAMKDGLLLYALREGTPDYLARLVTGREPSVVRATYGEANAKAIWREFEADRAAIATLPFDQARENAALMVRFHRWFENAGNGEAGRPSELGYWVGMQIAAAYVANSADPRAAIDTLIAMDDPAAILAKSGYGQSAEVPQRKK